MKWITKKVKYKNLIPADYNPRKLTKKEKDDLEKSIKKFGIVEIPVANLNNNLLAGHQRVMLKLSENPEYEDDVRFPDRLLTEQEEKEYNIRSNKNTGSWDFELLANFDNTDLIEWGFEDIELPDFNFDVSDEDFIDHKVKEELNNKTEKEKGQKDIIIECPHCKKTFNYKI